MMHTLNRCELDYAELVNITVVRIFNEIDSIMYVVMYSCCIMTIKG